MAKQIVCANILGNDGSMIKLDWDSGLPVVVIDGKDWEVFHVSDLNANDNDKAIAVPAGYEYQVLFVYIEWTSTATVGNRQLEIQIRDAGDTVIGQIRPGVVQAASLTRRYMFAPSLADLVIFRDTDYLMTPFPPTVFLPAGYDIRVYDNNSVDGNDDFNFHLHVARREL